MQTQAAGKIQPGLENYTNAPAADYLNTLKNYVVQKIVETQANSSSMPNPQGDKLGVNIQEALNFGAGSTGQINGNYDIEGNLRPQGRTLGLG